MDLNLQLIEAVKKHPLLYKGHGDLKTRERIWAEIARDLNCPIQVAISRWHMLSNVYKRFLEKHFNKDGNCTQSSNISYMKALSFLEPIISTKLAADALLNAAKAPVIGTKELEQEEERIIEPEFIISEIDLNEHCNDNDAVFYEIDPDDYGPDKSISEQQIQNDEKQFFGNYEENHVLSVIHLQNESNDSEEVHEERIEVIEERIGEAEYENQHVNEQYEDRHEKSEYEESTDHLIIENVSAEEVIDSSAVIEKPVKDEFSEDDDNEGPSEHLKNQILSPVNSIKDVQCASTNYASGKVGPTSKLHNGKESVQSHKELEALPRREKSGISNINEMTQKQFTNKEQHQQKLNEFHNRSERYRKEDEIVSPAVQRTTERCEDDVFGELVAAHLKRMSPSKKTETKRAIMNLLFV